MDDTRKKISVIILNYNDSDTTIKLADNVAAFKSESINAVVVDNKSTDESYDILRKRYSNVNNVDVIKTEKNGGYSYGNNLGAFFAIKKYSPDFIVISNPDINVSEDTIISLTETFEKSDTIGMCAPVMMNIEGKSSVHSQKLPSLTDDIFACFEKYNRTLSYEQLEYFDNNDNCVVTQMLPGCFFMIKAEVFKQIGGLDENVFLFCEERILGRKLRDAGFKLILRIDLDFVHAHSVTIKKHFDIIQTQKMIFNSRYYYQKMYNSVGIVRLIILKICAWSGISILQLKLWAHDKLRGNYRK